MHKTIACTLLLCLWLPGAVSAQRSSNDLGRMLPDYEVQAEFAFTRLIFASGISYLPGPGNSAWRDWPDSDYHFMEGLQRLTIVDVDRNSHAVNLFDDRIYDYPWLYALEVGTWMLTDEEAARLREYFDRGGFMIIDDFHGTSQWAGFERTMKKVFPDRPIVDIAEGHEIMHTFYDIDQRTQIPGILGLDRGGYEHDGYTPHWRGIYDEQGRLAVIINFNMDLGDAWELADMPYYPEPLTALAYRFGVNYVIYGMTH